jgi:hypothetical protein
VPETVHTVAQSTSAHPVHHIRIGEALWSPHDYAVLVHVAADASRATFELRLETERDEDGSFRKVVLRKSRLPASRAVTGSRSNPRSSAPSNSHGAKRSALDWEDLVAPVVRKNRYEITPRHVDYLAEKTAEHFAGRTSQLPGLPGIEVRDLTSHARKFGLARGDVMQAVNGVEIKTMAGARKLVMQLYRKGVRSFRVRILRQGRVVTLAYSLRSRAWHAR